MASTDTLRAALLALCLAAPAAAHEFWIAPADYILDPGQDLVAELRVGEGFVGDTLSYFPPSFVAFDLLAGEDRIPLPGRMGDDPALNVSGLPEGLLTLVYVSQPSEVTYDDPEVYARFLETEGLQDIAARNAERGLDPVGMTERFTRHARALVASGAGEGADRPAGLRLEIVAETNPYAGDTPEIALQVLLDGGPHGAAPLRVLARGPDGTVTETRHATDAEGRARIPAPPGAEILANTVWLEETDPATGAPWHSHWASLTFRRPD
jgi:hypothetical protein